MLGVRLLCGSTTQALSNRFRYWWQVTAYLFIRTLPLLVGTHLIALQIFVDVIVHPLQYR